MKKKKINNKKEKYFNTKIEFQLNKSRKVHILCQQQNIKRFDNTICESSLKRKNFIFVHCNCKN